jgi:hypothetical protein
MTREAVLRRPVRELSAVPTERRMRGNAAGSSSSAQGDANSIMVDGRPARRGAYSSFQKYRSWMYPLRQVA